MHTDEELRQLEADNLERGTRVWTTHFFSHFGSSETERSDFRDALREAGFGTTRRFAEIGTDEEVSAYGYWHHWAFTVFDADPAMLRRADGRARSIANERGVRYDGWKVQRHAPVETGQPRLADD